MAALFHLLIYQPLLNIMLWLLAVTPGHNLAVAVVLLTLLVRLLFIRLSYRGLVAQIKLQRLQPVMNRIREEFKGEPARQNAEMNKLYKKEGVNPFGGCLPLLVQLPFLFVLYSVFRANLSALPAKDIYSFTPHPTNVGSSLFGLSLTHVERIHFPPNAAMLAVIGLALAAALIQFWQTRMLQPTIKQPGAEMNRQLMFTMPAVSFVIALSLPPALPLYWITTNLFTVAQQLWFFRRGELVPSRVETLAAPSEAAEIGEAASLSMPSEIKREKRGSVEITIRKKGDRR